MIRPDARINSILSIDNFNSVVSFCKKRDTKDLTISANSLQDIVFHYFSSKKSEVECEMMIQKCFNLSNLIIEIKNASKDFLLCENDGLKVNPLKYINWKKLIFLNGQDIFIVSNFGKDIKLDWPFSIPMKSNVLNIALSEGYAENHCHLSAASPIFDINWIILHNLPSISYLFGKIKNDIYPFFKKYYNDKVYNQFLNISLLSIYLRRYLYFLLKPNKLHKMTRLSIENISFEYLSKNQPAFVDYVLSKIKPISFNSCLHNKILYDYACSSSSSSPLFGERKFLRDLVEAFPNISRIDQAYFYLYLICKRFIASFFIQNNCFYGFKNFKRFEQTTELFFYNESSLLKNEINQIAFETIAQSPHLKMAEIRIAPKSSVFELSSRISQLCPKKRLNIKFGLVIHFIKESCSFDENEFSYYTKKVLPRSYDLIKKYEIQTSVIKKYATLRRGINVLPLVGIDAANEEIRCRPELFAPFYRELRYSRLTHFDEQRKTLGLHFTFHAGEDFVTITDGLRAIFEAINYLEISNGDRIGHASALGTDIKKYHSLKGKKMIQTKQNFLDDCCFLYNSILSLPDLEDARNCLSNLIDKQLIDIYGFSNLKSYLFSLLLRTDHPDVHKKQNRAGSFFEKKRFFSLLNKRFYLPDDFEDDYKLAWNDNDALKYIHLYHYSLESRKKGNYITEQLVTDTIEQAICAAQKELVITIKKRNIIIETNPTSNYLIGPFEDFDDIPSLNLLGLNKNKEYYRGLRISIGTDDPGLFNISLHNEYGSILYSIQEHGLLSGNELIDEIHKLAKSSLDASFILNK